MLLGADTDDRGAPAAADADTEETGAPAAAAATAAATATADFGPACKLGGCCGSIVPCGTCAELRALAAAAAVGDRERDSLGAV